jgi:hypothetical protein
MIRGLAFALTGAIIMLGFLAAGGYLPTVDVCIPVPRAAF